MSLLMDALRRAEKAKHEAASPAPGGAAASPGLALEPAGEASSLPELANHLARVDADLQSVTAASVPPGPSAPPAQPAAAAAKATAQAAARQVFAAKTASAPPASGRGPFYAVLGVTALSAAAIGAYFYLQLRALSAPPPARVSAAPPDRPTAAPDRVSPPPMAASPALTAPAVPPTPPAAATKVEPASARPPAREDRPPRKPAANDELAAPTAPIHLSASPPKLNPALGDGYQALQRGAYDAAQSAYAAALRDDPHNPDALLGLATLAAHQGESERAQALYAKVLEADPKNASALAGLIGLRQPADPVQAESRLKSLLSGEAADAARAGNLHFALGNLYAAQQRWNEAQHAYFQAYSADPGNPDYHYNLAVSLDHLQQPKLAAQFYQSALEAAKTRPASFDPAPIKARLGALQP